MYHKSVHVCQWDLCKKYVQKSYSSAVFICQNIKKKLFEDGHFVYNLLYFNGIENVVPTSLQFIWRCSQNCGLLKALPFDKSST